MKEHIKLILLYSLSAIVVAVVIIFMFTLWKMVMYRDCINHTSNIYYCEAKWL